MSKRKQKTDYLYKITKWVEKHQKMVIPAGALILVAIILLFYKLDNARTYNEEIVIEAETNKVEETSEVETQPETTEKETKEEIKIDYVTYVNKQLCFQIDSFEKSDECFFVDGFCFSFDNENLIKNPEFYLKDMSEDNDELIPIGSDYGVERKDVSDYFGVNVDCLDSGFKFKIKCDDIEPNREYQVCVISNDDCILTGTYISKEGIAYYSREETKEPDLVDTDLEKVVSDGVFRLYNRNAHYYVYQYDNELYWILEDSTVLEDSDFNNRLEYHVSTTQLELMDVTYEPNIQELDFIMDKEEVTNEINCGKYRVAHKSLPTMYPIETIMTGSWDFNTKRWVWKDDFRPYYYFNRNMYEWMDNPQEN